MKITKVVRSKKGGLGSLHAVIAANVGESDSETAVSSHQDVEIVQRSGRTEVREHHTDDAESS